MAQSTKMVATMGASDVGDIAKALSNIADNDTKTVAHLGVIVGMATGVSYRSNKFGDGPSIALIGTFEGTPYDPDSSVVISQSLFMPAAVQAALVSSIMGDKKHAVTKAPKIGQKVDLALDGVQMPVQCEIGVLRNADKSGAGYRFEVNLVGERQKIDVLEKLRADIIKNAPNERVRMLGQNQPKFTAIAPPKKERKPAKKKTK